MCRKASVCRKSPDETADTLNLSRAMVYDLMRLRALKSVKIGRARRIPVDAVREYVSRLTDDELV